MKPGDSSTRTQNPLNSACQNSTSTQVNKERKPDGFGGLVVSMLASGTRVCGFKLGRSRWGFQASEKSSICLPSEGK